MYWGLFCFCFALRVCVFSYCALEFGLELLSLVDLGWITFVGVWTVDTYLLCAFVGLDGLALMSNTIRCWVDKVVCKVT